MALQPLQNYYNMIDVPDAGKAFEEGMLWRRQEEARRAQVAEGEAIKKDLVALGTNPSVSQITDFITRYPQMAERFQAKLKLMSTQEREQRQSQAIPIYSAMMHNKPEIAISLLQQQADAARNSGNEAGAKTIEDQIKFIQADPASAKTSFGVSMAALMGPDKFSDTYNSLETNLREQDLHPSKLAKAEADAVAAAKSQGVEVQSSQILPNGTTIIIAKDGTRQVRDVNGNIVTGADAALAVELAQQAGIRYAGGKAGTEAQARATVEAAAAPTIAGGAEAGKAGVQAGTAALQTATKISGQLSNLRRARELAANGANTGVIASKFPNWSASSVELANMRNQLGLDVIGQASFGALSEGELNLALNTALPTNLNETELVTWLDNKIAAQEKMRSEMMKAAKFLSKPGNTLDKWLEQNGGAPAAPAAPANDLAAAAAAELARRRGGG